MAVHPPAMGGKTAWGVGEVTSRPSDDPAEILRAQKAQAEFDQREEARLQRLKALERDAGNIAENRAARRQAFQPEMTKGVDEFKKRQDEILKRMEEAKVQRRLERKRKKDAEGGGKKRKNKKKKKKDSSSSGSDSDSDSDDSDSDSSSSSGKKKKKKKDKGKKGDKDATKGAEQEQAGEPVAAANAALLAAARQRALEAKAKEREVKRKAKEQLAAWEAEQRKKAVEEEAKRQADAKRKDQEAEAKKMEDARRRTEEAKAREEEAKRKADEAEAKKSAEAEKRKSLFAASTSRVSRAKSGQGGAKVAGGYKVGEYVSANQDITVRGNLVVRSGTTGTIKGPAETDPVGRIAVEFTTRADGLNGVLNVVPKEIRKG